MQTLTQKVWDEAWRAVGPTSSRWCRSVGPQTAAIGEGFRPVSQGSASRGESTDACGIEETMVLNPVNGDNRAGFTQRSLPMTFHPSRQLHLLGLTVLPEGCSTSSSPEISAVTLGEFPAEPRGAETCAIPTCSRTQMPTEWQYASI